MPITKKLYPYEVSAQLGLRPHDPYDPENEDLDLDWLVRKGSDDDDDVQVIDLASHEVPWTSLKFKLEASLPSDELARVLPPPSNPETDALLVVTVACTDTRVRRAVLLERRGDSWEADVTISRSEMRGTVRLTPRLVRKTSLPLRDGESALVAVNRGFFMAEGRSLDLRLDPPDVDLSGVLRVLWEDFSTSEDPWRRAHADDVFSLDVDGAEPTLYLNSVFPELKAAMHSKARVGSTAIVRHLSNALIAQSAWLQLFVCSVSAIEIDDDVELAELPPDGWRRQVLEVLLPRAFPGLEKGEQLARLQNLRSEGQEGLLFTVLSSAAQSVAKTHSLFKSAIRAAESIRTEGQ